MSTAKWGAFSARGNLGTTSALLDSLASATLSVMSDAIDNSANLDIYAIIEIVLGSLTPVGTPPYIELYMVKALDGVDYEDAPSLGGGNTDTLIQTIPLTTTTSAKRVTSDIFILPPCPVAFYVGNQSGAALAASGNALNLYTSDKVIA